ncbi:hypothetical protein D3C76_1747870 [compost metagenome]
MDRAAIDKSKLRSDLSEDLDLEDYKFILLNLRQIVDALSLVDFKKPDDLYNCIINTLAVA